MRSVTTLEADISWGTIFPLVPSVLLSCHRFAFNGFRGRSAPLISKRANGINKQRYHCSNKVHPSSSSPCHDVIEGTGEWEASVECRGRWAMFEAMNCCHETYSVQTPAVAAIDYLLSLARCLPVSIAHFFPDAAPCVSLHRYRTGAVANGDPIKVITGIDKLTLIEMLSLLSLSARFAQYRLRADVDSLPEEASVRQGGCPPQQVFYFDVLSRNDEISSTPAASRIFIVLRALRCCVRVWLPRAHAEQRGFL